VQDAELVTLATPDRGVQGVVNINGPGLGDPGDRQYGEQQNQGAYSGKGAQSYSSGDHSMNPGS
jgi:hypothetical protein